MSQAEPPAPLVRTHRLYDGRMVTIRPISVQDEAVARAFLNHLSEESRYLRFHEWVSAPSDKLVHFLTDIDHDKHMAYVCTVSSGDHEKLVGEARYVVNPDGLSCEFGIMIADEWHKSGIAGILMQALIETARNRGLKSMEGLVLRRNRGMIRFARGLGFEIDFVAQDPTAVRVRKRLR